METILFYIFFTITVSYILLIGVLMIGLLRGFQFEKQEMKSGDLKISVIIPFRNEEEMLRKCLVAVSEQSYPKNLYEVILIDDSSKDNSLESIQDLLVGNVKMYSLTEFEGKKAAISLGVSKATNEIIVTTDADCSMGVDWLLEVSNNFGSADMLVLPVAIEYSNSFSAFQALDYLSLQGVTVGAIGLNNPVMCSGANLAYRKTIFNVVNGYKGNETIPSGDDVFLLEKFSKSYNVNYYYSKKVVVYSNAVKTVNEFLQQRIRWGGKMKNTTLLFSKISGVIVLALNVSVFFAFLLSFFYSDLLILTCYVFLLKVIVDFFFLALVAVYTEQKALLYYFITSEIKNFIYIIILVVFGRVISVKWKDRQIN